MKQIKSSKFLYQAAKFLSFASIFLITVVLIIAIRMWLMSELTLVEFADALSKLLIPFILIIVGEFYRRANLQISQKDKIKIKKLTELVDQLYALNDLIPYFHEESVLWINELEDKEFKEINDELIKSFAEQFNSTRQSFNEARIFIDNKELITKIEIILEKINSLRAAFYNMKYEKSRQTYAENSGKYKAAFNELSDGNLIKGIENEIKKILN